MPWPSEWDDDDEVAVDDRPPRPVLDLGEPQPDDRRPVWTVDEIGERYER